MDALWVNIVATHLIARGQGHFGRLPTNYDILKQNISLKHLLPIWSK